MWYMIVSSTDVPLQLAHEMFGQSTAMIRIDGSEYSESHSISRLVRADYYVYEAAIYGRCEFLGRLSARLRGL